MIVSGRGSVFDEEKILIDCVQMLMENTRLQNFWCNYKHIIKSFRKTNTRKTQCKEKL